MPVNNPLGSAHPLAPILEMKVRHMYIQKLGLLPASTWGNRLTCIPGTATSALGFILWKRTSFHPVSIMTQQCGG